MTGPTIDWNDDRTETLKRLWAAGASARTIAAAIGGGCTKSAIVGKIHRLGLSGRVPGPKPVKPRVERTPPASKRPASEATKAAPSASVSKPAPVPQPAPVAEPAEPISRFECFDPADRATIDLGDLRNGICRWPFGDRPPHQYCGARTADPSDPRVVYCRSHAALAYNPPKSRAA